MYNSLCHSALRSLECESFIEQTQTYLDAVVVNGSDQELFIASYLTGHFAVVVGQARMEDDAAAEKMNTQRLNELLLNSLNIAFLQNELEKDEQKLVLGLWRKLTHTSFP